MKVILRQNVDTLGKVGDVVNVKDGYAINFLIPRKLVYPAVEGKLKAIEVEKKHSEVKRGREIKAAQVLAADLEKVSITIPVQVGEEDRIFGTVTTQMIAEGLKEKGFDIDKRKIEVEEQIKTLGIYNVHVKLHQSVATQIKVWVVRE